jgi:hypothetical protein
MIRYGIILLRVLLVFPLGEFKNAFDQWFFTLEYSSSLQTSFKSDRDAGFYRCALSRYLINYLNLSDEANIVKKKFKITQ